MRKIIRNANIYHSEANTITIEDGIIQEVYQSDGTETGYDEEIDLKGAFLLPGFIDSHLHILNLGNYLSNVSLAGLSSIEELLECVKNHLHEVPTEQWFYARGFNESVFEKPVFPTKQMLDEISTEVPIVLTRTCGHMMVVNSKVLEICNIHEDVERNGGRIDFETGCAYEHALDEIRAMMPVPTREDLARYLLKAMKELNAFGITGVGSDDFISLTENWELPLDMFLQQSYQKNLTVRISEQCEFHTLEEFARFLDEGYTTGVGNEQFQIGPLKMIMDGSLGARTARLSHPYADDPSTQGMLCYSEDEFARFVELATSYNMPTITHAIGDETVDVVLNTYEDSILEGNPLGLGLVHCQIMRQDQIERIAKMKLYCFIQSLFINGDSVFYENRVGDLAKTSYPHASLYRNTLTANGSDAPVEIPNVLKGIYLAITRKSIDFDGSMDEKECLTIEEAIDSYTCNGAKAIGREEDLGKIAPGYHADFVVLDHDLCTCKPEEILTTKVLLTFFDGEEVYQA